MTVSKGSMMTQIAAIYALILSIGIGVGTITKLAGIKSEGTGSALSLHLVYNLIVCVTMAASGIALLAKQDWGRHLFFIIAPIASLFLAISYPEMLWKEDVPYTALLILCFVIFSFFLSRRKPMLLFNQTKADWQTRGAMTLAICAGVILLIKYLFVHKPRSYAFDGVDGFYRAAAAANTYVTYSVSCDMLMWNYIAACFFVSILHLNSLNKSM